MHIAYVHGIARTQSPYEKITHPSHQHISGDRRGQPSQRAMERLRSGPTAALIAVQPVPGKYEELQYWADPWRELGKPSALSPSKNQFNTVVALSHVSDIIKLLKPIRT